MRRAARALLLGLVLGACHRDSAGVVADAAPPPPPPAATAADAEAIAPKPTVLPARCQPGGAGFALDDGHGMDDLEIGDAIADPVAASPSTSSTARPRAVSRRWRCCPSVLRRCAARSRPDARRRASAARGAPRARPASRCRTSSPSARTLASCGVYTMSAHGRGAEPRATIPEQRDDSLAFDLAPTPGGVGRGEAGAGSARASSASRSSRADAHAGARTGRSRRPSPTPRCRASSRARGGGVLRLLDGAQAGGCDARSTPRLRPRSRAKHGRTRGSRSSPWTPHGTAVGAARRLTPRPVTSRPTTSVRSRATAGRRARRGSRRRRGRGRLGRRAAARAGAGPTVQDPPLAFATDGLGRGAPAFVDGSPPWLSWVAPARGGVGCFRSTRAGLRRASKREPALDEARPLAWIRAGAGACSRRCPATLPRSSGFCHAPQGRAPALDGGPSVPPRLSTTLPAWHPPPDFAPPLLIWRSGCAMRAHSSIGQSPRLITGPFLVRTQVGPLDAQTHRSTATPPGGPTPSPFTPGLRYVPRTHFFFVPE